MSPRDIMIKTNDAQTIKTELAQMLAAYLLPAFGALPKSEIDLLFLSSLQRLGYISETPEIYELVSKLRVTRTKARPFSFSPIQSFNHLSLETAGKEQ
jgi:hypothetical protein